MSDARITLTITTDDADRFTASIADTICWLLGFHAAKPKADLPPDWEGLRELNIKLKDALRRTEQERTKT